MWQYMKIKIKRYNNYWRYNLNEWNYTQVQFDYIFKYLDFDKLDKIRMIYFNDKKTEKWFLKTYINDINLETICNKSPEGYEWLKEHWGNGVFKLYVCYLDKQEFKTVINKIINVELKG